MGQHEKQVQTKSDISGKLTKKRGARKSKLSALSILLTEISYRYMVDVNLDYQKF